MPPSSNGCWRPRQHQIDGRHRRICPHTLIWLSQFQTRFILSTEPTDQWRFISRRIRRFASGIFAEGYCLRWMTSSIITMIMVSHTEPPNTYQARSVNRQKEILSEKYAFPFNVQPTKRSGLFVATQARHETGSPNGAVRLANCGQFTARTMGRPAKQVAEAETGGGRARHSVRAVGARLDAPPRLRRAGDCPPYLRPGTS